MFVKAIFCEGLWIRYSRRGTILLTRGYPTRIAYPGGSVGTAPPETVDPNRRRYSAMTHTLAGVWFFRSICKVASTLVIP